MQYTTHYNLNLPEGTDVVNPLIQDNPNYSAIDAAMFANKQAVIGTASEVASGTAHAITRANTDSNYFRFTATSNWTAGDTITVDGLTVSAYLSDGTTPRTGAYVINSEVFCILSGTRLTLIISGTPIASDISYDNTSSGLSASNVQDAIDELDANSGHFAIELDLGVQPNIEAAWDAINVYDHTVVGHYNNGGQWMFIAYKYSGSQYGMMQSQPYFDNYIAIMKVSGGVKTTKTISGV